MHLTVIIPTYNRAKILTKCLNELSKCNFDQSHLEIIVIDDGSTDETNKIDFASNVKYVYQKNSGQGTARNNGIQLATSNILIFIGDDIFIDKNFLSEHENFHIKNNAKNIACLGQILWDPNINISRLMRWSTNELTLLAKFGGHQFAFNKIHHNESVGHNYFYTSNVSIKKEMFQQQKFDTDFKGYGWEDIELGYRLQKENNLKIIYNQNAIAYHSHKVTMNDFQKRMIQVGSAVHIFQQKHKELNIIPNLIKKTIFQIISSKLAINTINFINKMLNGKLDPVYFYCLSKKYFLIGLNSKLQ